MSGGIADQASGARSTALVSQGHIGRVVSAKPTDRRKLLEEAAGITGLHSRRHEAELRFDASAATILFFDDLQENVDAATRCGWNAIRIDPHEPVSPQVERGLAAFGVAV